MVENPKDRFSREEAHFFLLSDFRQAEQPQQTTEAVTSTFRGQNKLINIPVANSLLLQDKSCEILEIHMYQIASGRAHMDLNPQS